VIGALQLGVSLIIVAEQLDWIALHCIAFDGTRIQMPCCVGFSTLLFERKKTEEEKRNSSSDCIV